MNVNEQAWIQSRQRQSFAEQRRARRRREHPGARKIKRAEPGCCQFLIQADGIQSECGQPATHEGIGRNRLLYCKAHAEWLNPQVRSLKP